MPMAYKPSRRNKNILKKNGIDILLISETHFTDKSYINIPNDKTYQINHPDGKAHGGSATIIKDFINHYVLQKYEEASSIKIMSFPYPLTVSAIYCPPRYNLKKSHFETFFHALGNQFIAGGDFNSKHTI
jgi:exonuclease III